MDDTNWLERYFHGTPYWSMMKFSLSPVHFTKRRKLFGPLWEPEYAHPELPSWIKINWNEMKLVNSFEDYIGSKWHIQAKRKWHVVCESMAKRRTSTRLSKVHVVKLQIVVHSESMKREFSCHRKTLQPKAKESLNNCVYPKSLSNKGKNYYITKRLCEGFPCQDL